MYSVILVAILFIIGLRADDPDISRLVPELITSKGYPCETHYIVTPDYFVLGVHRVPHGKNGVSTKGPILLQHGLLSSSVDWVFNLANESLAFILADQGYDVWLANSRGNQYSRNNTKLSPDDPNFWAWSWDQMGLIDIPTCIDYILSLTNSNQLSGFVAVSQGGGASFALLSTMPQYASKIKIFVAMAPVVFAGHVKSLLLRYAAEFDFDELLEMLGDHEFLPSTQTLRTLFPEFVPDICDDLISTIAGVDQSDLNVTRLPVYLGHWPAGTSVQDLAKWAQAIRTDTFQMFDYGTQGNIQHYNSSTPPVFNLGNVPSSLPIAVFTGGKDVLSNPTDLAHLFELIPPPVLIYNEPDFGHLDFTWGYHCIVCPTLLEIIAKYQ